MKSGNNGGTYAVSDIAWEFASWLSPEFKLYVIQEFERLKKNETYQYKLDWSANRMLAKTNYHIHTDSIKENIVPKLTEKQKQYVYADEADVLNVALFGITAKEWRIIHPNQEGNVRDYTDILYLIVLSNLEVLNSKMIENGISQKERLIELNKTAIKQLSILYNDNNVLEIEKLNKKLIDAKENGR